jgi:hypothetical protein
MNTPKLVGHGAMLVITSKVQQKIRCLPIVGEEYDFSFSVISEWDQQVPIIANRGSVQMKYHPQQRIQKSFLAECYLLQDCWTSDPDCIHQIYSNVILDSWESDDIYLRRIQLVKIATNVNLVIYSQKVLIKFLLHIFCERCSWVCDPILLFREGV